MNHHHTDQDEHAFGLAIKHALNESANALPQATLDKLYAARRQATSVRKVANSAGSIAGIWAITQRFLQKSMRSLANPLVFAVPALVLGVGLYILSSDNADNYVQTVAEIDAQVLTQELPINALLDKGFVHYVQVGE